MTVKHLLVVIAILISLFAAKFFFWDNKESAPHKSNIAQGNSPNTSENKSSSGTGKSEEKKETSEEKADWKKLSGPFRKSPGCLKKDAASKSLTLTSQEIFQLYRNHRSYAKSIIIDPFRFCLEEGTEVTVSDFTPRGKIKIIGLELIQINKQTLSPVSKLKIAASLKLGAWIPLVKDFFESYDFSPIKEDFRLGLFVVFDFIEKTDFEWDLAGSRKPPFIAGIRYVNKANLNEYSKYSHLIDVRSENEFKMGSLEKAVNLPYRIKYENLKMADLPPSVATLKNNVWKFNALPLDFEKPIIFFGTDAYDPRPWYAYLSLNLLKHPLLGWIYDGYNSLADIPPKVINVADYPLAKDKILNAKALLAMGKFNPKFVYVGSRLFDKKLFPDAVTIPYHEAVNTSDKPVSQWTSKLKSGGDTFTYAKKLANKSDYIILTDYDNSSNRPLKAAMMLQNEGFKNVYVYPNGLANLLELSLAVPEKVNCAILSSLSQCK